MKRQLFLMVISGLCILVLGQPVLAGSIAGPESCQDILNANPAAMDGDYVIYPGYQMFTVYCHNMDGTPSEYLSLVNTGGDRNFSQYTAGGYSQGQDVVTHYSKVRLDPKTLIVNVNDSTFATSNGGQIISGPGGGPVTEMNYAVAADCRATDSSTGRANIDLTGTPFAVNDTFVPDGYRPAGTATFSSDDQVVDLTGGGYCGWNAAGTRHDLYSPFGTTDYYPNNDVLSLQYVGPFLVIINGCNTGVVDVGGLNEAIAYEAANARNHGQFVSGVSELTNLWKKTGLITEAEKGMIVSCAGQADIP